MELQPLQNPNLNSSEIAPPNFGGGFENFFGTGHRCSVLWYISLPYRSLGRTHSRTENTKLGLVELVKHVATYVANGPGKYFNSVCFYVFLCFLYYMLHKFKGQYFLKLHKFKGQQSVHTLFLEKVLSYVSFS